MASIEPTPPPEAQTEAEKTAYCAGWWAALEAVRKVEPVWVQGELPPLYVARSPIQAEPVQEFASIPGANVRVRLPVQEPVADRAAFERHAERLGYSVDPDTRKGRDGGYWSSHTQLMWLTWQAALAEPQEPVRLECVTCGTVYADGVPPQVPVQEPDYWQQEARRYAGNADYWRKRYGELAEPVPTCRRAICQRGPDGYCAPCHERMYP